MISEDDLPILWFLTELCRCHFWDEPVGAGKKVADLVGMMAVALCSPFPSCSPYPWEANMTGSPLAGMVKDWAALVFLCLPVVENCSRFRSLIVKILALITKFLWAGFSYAKVGQMFRDMLSSWCWVLWRNASPAKPRCISCCLLLVLSLEILVREYQPVFASCLPLLSSLLFLVFLVSSCLCVDGSLARSLW